MNEGYSTLRRPFEEEIFLNLFRYGRSAPRTSAWVVGHLVDVGEDYVLSMHKRYLQFVETIPAYAKPPSYLEFSRIIWQLATEGKIRVARRLPGIKDGPFPRAYYTLV